MEFLVFWLICGIAAILLQMNDSCCEGTMALIYIATGPLGLIAKLLSKIL